MTGVPHNEILGSHASESQPEAKGKAAQHLNKLRLQTDIQQKLRETILREKTPVINETEDELIASSQTFEETHPGLNIPQPDFYQAA